MHPVDIVFAALTAVLMILGVKRGLVTEAFRFVAVVAGFAAAAAYYKPLAARLAFIHLSSGATVAIAFIALFVVAVLAVAALGWVVRKAIHMTVLGWVDRLGGGVLGAAKAVLVAWVLSLAAAAIPAPGIHGWLKPSLTYSVCRWLPMDLALPAALGMKRSIQNVVSQEPIADIPARIEEFRARVDSAKGAR